MTFNIETVSVQEAIDYSVQEMVAQGGQSLNERGSCVYKSSCGNKHCAIGHLLDKDDTFAMNFGGSVGVLPDTYVPRLVLQNMRPFQVLQEFHDSTMKKSRAKLVKRLGLLGIDVSGVWFNEWVAMGEGEV